jgi:ribonuclease T2
MGAGIFLPSGKGLTAVRRVRSLFLLLAGAILLAGTAARAGDIGPRPPGGFDYYVLALTWVPGFCTDHASNPECPARSGFALHGLWPQLESGDYPTACDARPLMPTERDRFGRAYASPSMIDHEWRKHGTCSGLPAARYFALAAADEARVAIPRSLRAPRPLRAWEARSVREAFLAANPGLPDAGVKVTTARGMLTGVEICLTKAGAFRSCPARG